MMMNAANAVRKIGGNCRMPLAAAGLTALVVALGCSCGKSNAAVNADVAIVPQANVVVKADIQGMQKAPIHAKMEAIREAEESSLPTEDVERMRELAQETLGLEKDDVHKMVLSADLSEIDFDADAPLNPSTLDMAAAVVVGKPVTLANIRTYLEKQAAEEEKEISIEKKDYNGISILYVQDPENKDGDDAAQNLGPEMPKLRLGIALQNEGKLILAGTEKGVQGALDRAQGKGKTAESESMARTRKQIPEDAQSYLAFVPPESMLAKLQEQVDQQAKMAEQGQGGNPMMTQSMRSLAGMKGAGFSMALDDAVNLALMLSVASDESAAQLKTMMDSMVIGSLKMMAMQFSGGKGMPMTDTIELVQDGSDLTLKVSINEEDMQSVIGGMKQMFMPGTQPRQPGQHGAPAPPPPPAPPAPQE